MTDLTRQDVDTTMRAHRICVIVPTYNNAGTLAQVIDDILQYTDSVIVVNDGSTDSTAEILARYADRVDAVQYARNRGKGHALRTGFRHALDRGFDYAITIDSDGQHYASDIPAFVEAVVKHPGALIVGARDLSNVDINGKSSFANKFSNFWFYVQTGRNLSDTQTGYRAYPLKKLRGLNLLTSRYEAELELMVFASWHGVDLVSIPIRVYYPPQSERVSHFRPAKDFTRISILNTILCVGAIGYGAPLRITNYFRKRKAFRGEVTMFTRKSGHDRRPASFTVNRFLRTVFGYGYFGVGAMAFLTPLSVMMRGRNGASEANRRRLHQLLQKGCKDLLKKFPGATTEVLNPEGEDFERPSLVVCNHQSHLDLPVLLSVSARFIILTNDWVWNNPVYGRLVQNAEFLPVSAGIDAIMPRLRDLVSRGYSIVVFPEGTRSADCRIMRFHQGAFHMARELGLDIVPMTLHGAGHYLPKKEHMFRRGKITLSILPRVSAAELKEMPAREQASMFRAEVRREYERLERSVENLDYHRSLILYKYAYRGWDVVARCKEALRGLEKYKSEIDGTKEVRRVRVLNSGIGVFALAYALVNKDVEVVAYEGNLRDSLVAQSTAALPPNLTFVNAVWDKDYGDPSEFDKTIILDARAPALSETPDGATLIIPIRS